MLNSPIFKILYAKIPQCFPKHSHLMDYRLWKTKDQQQKKKTPVDAIEKKVWQILCKYFALGLPSLKSLCIISFSW